MYKAIVFLWVIFISVSFVQDKEHEFIYGECKVKITNRKLYENLVLFTELYSDQKPFVVTVDSKKVSDTLVYFITYVPCTPTINAYSKYALLKEQLIVFNTSMKGSCKNCQGRIQTLVKEQKLNPLTVHRSSGFILQYKNGTFIRKQCWHKSSLEEAGSCEE